MPKRARELTAIQVKRLSKPGRHPVGGTPPGLYLNISETGAKSWIFRITVKGRRQHLGLGSFPEVSLAEARDLAGDIKRKVRAGIDPIEERRAAAAARAREARQHVTFEVAFEKYYAEKVEREQGNAKHVKQWRSTIETYAFPVIGKKPVASITVEDILSVLQPIWEEKNETASRVRQRIEAVLDWAGVMGFREGANPARWKGNLQQALPSPGKLQKAPGHPAIALEDATTWFHLLRARNGLAARALEFLTLTASRSGEVRGALWEEMDMSGGIWTIPAERMKAKREHRVPLSQPALELLKQLPRIKDCPFVFPSPRNGQMSDMTLSAVMRRIHGDETKKGRPGFLDPRSRRPAVPHGLRSTFRDWAAERTSYPREMAEIALAHQVGSDVERAYRRGDMLEKRRGMMDDWARFLCA